MRGDSDVLGILDLNVGSANSRSSLFSPSLSGISVSQACVPRSGNRNRISSSSS